MRSYQIVFLDDNLEASEALNFETDANTDVAIFQCGIEVFAKEMGDDEFVFHPKDYRIHPIQLACQLTMVEDLGPGALGGMWLVKMMN